MVVPGAVWPPQCCVPAFLGNAVASLSAKSGALADEAVRRAIAEAMGVVVGPDDANPWDLRVSSHPPEWGVPVEAARDNLHRIAPILGLDDRFRLEIRPLNTIAFELYEDEVVELTGPGALLGISFDYPELYGFRRADQAGTHRPGRHVARLTPVTPAEQQETTIESPAFGFDYSGSVRLFDDSGEMTIEDCLVDWRRLLLAAWEVDGGFWRVRRLP